MMRLEFGKSLHRWLTVLHKIEDSFLVLLLTAMIGLSVSQIILRNVFGSGISWAGPMTRLLVLWVGLAGAMVATRQDHHITIDVLTRYMQPTLKKLVRMLVDVFTGTVSVIIAYHAVRLVQLDRKEQTIAFEQIPAWWCEMIIPVVFAVIGLRYFVHLFLLIFNAPLETKSE